MEQVITRQQPSELFQTIGQIFNPNTAREVIDNLTFPRVEDAECKVIKPTTVTEDMYMQMAGYILENIEIERESRTGGVGYFDTREQCFFTENDKIEVVWQARGSVLFRTSHEEWGKERNLTQASILFADCQTYDEDGDKTDNDFSTKELEKYLQP